MNPSENQTPEIQDYEEKVEQLRQCLEKKENFMGTKLELLKYENFWYRTNGLKFILHYQAHFQARDSDIILASFPKTGTTWLKSLLFSIVNRGNPDHQPLNKKSPLLTHNPHELVYHLEHGVYMGGNPLFPTPQQLHDQVNSLRLLQTHVPYTSLPESIKTLSCKIVYIARNPLDTFVSQWHWYMDLFTKATAEPEFQVIQPPSIEDFFEDFCRGKIPYGPYFDHVLGFWKQSLEQPNKVLFFKYEDLKGDEYVVHLKKLAEFVGFPFTQQEENEGVISEITKLCSINNLKELEVNKTGFMNQLVEKKNYFRKGEVGDWTNYFTPSMVERINMLMQEKLRGTGLSFESLTHSRRIQDHLE